MKEDFKNVMLLNTYMTCLVNITIIHELIFLGCSLLGLQMPCLSFEGRWPGFGPR